MNKAKGSRRAKNPANQRAHAGFALSSLPLELFEKVATHLSTQERAWLACTSKALSQLAGQSASYWASVEFAPVAADQAEQLCLWVVPRRQQVQTLKLDVGGLPSIAEYEPEGFSRITSLLGTLGGSALTSLELHLGTIPDVYAVRDWLLPLPQLQRLQLSCEPPGYGVPETEARFTAALSRQLAALTHLSLDGFWPLDISDGSLPAGLRELSIVGSQRPRYLGTELVAMVALAARAVTRLESLTLGVTIDRQGGEAPKLQLDRLPGSFSTLTHLRLHAVLAVLADLRPLAALSGLRKLELEFAEDGKESDGMEEAVAECLGGLALLTHLTELRLAGCGPSVPPSLDPLWRSPSLKVLSLLDCDLGGPLPQPLLASHIEHLQITYDTAAEVAGQLGSWQSLRELELPFFALATEELLPLLEELGSATQLRRLVWGLPSSRAAELKGYRKLGRAVARLRAARPALEFKLIVE